MPSNDAPLRAAVIGYGAYGRLHARKYRLHPAVELVAIVDRDATRLRLAAREFPGVPRFERVDPANPPDIASIVVPAHAHQASAMPLLRAGSHLLIEKPFTTSARAARQLMHEADLRHLVLQPGYLERFNGTIRELQRHLPAPRYIEARRLTSWRGRGGDVSVVLDLMIHDIDMVLALVDTPITDIQARGVQVVTGHWDVANARLYFANGCIANLTASRASPAPERRLHVFTDDACALADLSSGEILVHRRDPEAAGVMTEHRYAQLHDPLGAEIDAFVAAVQNHAPPPVSGADACRALEVAERIVEAMEDDADLLSNTAAPFTDSEQAIAYLLEHRQSHGH